MDLQHSASVFSSEAQREEFIKEFEQTLTKFGARFVAYTTPVSPEKIMEYMADICRLPSMRDGSLGALRDIHITTATNTRHGSVLYTLTLISTDSSFTMRYFLMRCLFFISKLIPSVEEIDTGDVVIDDDMLHHFKERLFDRIHDEESDFRNRKGNILAFVADIADYAYEILASVNTYCLKNIDVRKELVVLTRYVDHEKTASFITDPHRKEHYQQAVRISTIVETCRSLINSCKYITDTFSDQSLKAKV